MFRRPAPLHVRLRRRAWWPDGPATEGAASNPTGFAPIIRSQPSNVTAVENNTATFRVEAVGEPLTYQWQVDSGGGFVDVVGATGASYTTPVLVAATHDGYLYRVVVTNAFGSTTSSSATLTVQSGLQPPTISVQPSSVDRPIGKTQTNTASFSVTATGATSYQWQVDDGGGFDDIGGATGDTYNRSNIATFDANGVALTDEDGYQFRCVVTNGAGSVTSDAATLTTHRATPAEIIAATGATISYWEADQHVYEASSDPAENGDGVVEWRDLSAAAYHWTQTGGDSFEPLFVTNAINGLPGVHLGTSAVRRFTNAGTLVASGDWYAVFAYDYIATEANIDYLFYDNTNAVGFFTGGSAPPSGTANRAGYRSPAGAVYQTPADTNATGAKILEGGFVGADLTISCNGWTNQATHNISGGPHVLQNLEFGSRSSSGHRVNVEMYGAAVYSGNNADVKRDLRWYFATKIGATLS